MHIVAVILIGFIAAGILFTWLIFYLMSSSKRELESRTALLTEQIIQAGVAFDPVTWRGEYFGRQYEFILANDEGPTLRVDANVKNRLHGQLWIHPKKRIGRFVALTMGVKEKRVLTGDAAFDRVFITTSVPASFGETVVGGNSLLREHLLKERRTSISLEENRLSLFPNLTSENHLDVEQWRQYLAIIETLAAAIEA